MSEQEKRVPKPTFTLADFEKDAKEKLAGGSANDDGLFTINTANWWMEQAKNCTIPQQLFRELWHSGEVCILFADTNTGKSILAVQIGNDISKVQQVLYFDFELSKKQFQARYSNNYDHPYCFNDNLHRIEINPDAELPERMLFEEYLNECMERAIVKTGAKIMIIDNLTYLRQETERAKDALPLMKELKKLKNKHNLSILTLAHTPKRDMSKPITRNDLQGSKMLMNFCDSAFAIGESANDNSIRYIKQIKARNTEVIYDSENIIIARIVKPDNFLRFEFTGYGMEREHLSQVKDREEIKAKVVELHKKGRSLREIGAELGMSHVSVRKIVKKHNAC